MVRDGRAVELVSAGGVVLRKGRDGDEVVLCGRSDPVRWALPKGTPDPGETREQTALREVREETGLDVQIVRQLDSIQYWFLRSSDGARCHKTVHYYLMAPTGGDTSRHDDEFDFVEWFPLPQAIEAMTYPNEARIVKKSTAVAAQ